MDERTSDVCRACFISIDNEAFYNPNAEAVNMDAYIKKEDVCELFDVSRNLMKEIKENIVNKNVQWIKENFYEIGCWSSLKFKLRD